MWNLGNDSNTRRQIVNVQQASERDHPVSIRGEVFKNRNEFAAEGLEESTAIEKELLIEDMEKMIDTLSIPEHKKKNGLKAFKNIINRAFITGREAHTLKGILRRLKNNLD